MLAYASQEPKSFALLNLTKFCDNKLSLYLWYSFILVGMIGYGDIEGWTIAKIKIIPRTTITFLPV